MTKHTILFLAANPRDTDRLALDEEARAIQEELERSGHRDKFELVTRWAVRPMDLLRELRKLGPTVLHFSGHARRSVLRPGTAPHWDDDDQCAGLLFQGPDRRSQLVSTAALGETICAAGASVKLAVLSACFTEQQAEALLSRVDCVVGTGGSIRDDAARSFAVGFYGGLGEQQSVEAAYRQGCAAIGLEGIPDGDKPQLRVRPNVDADKLVLATNVVSTALERLVANAVGVDAIKSFVSSHADVLLNLSPAEWDWTEAVTDLSVNDRLRPHFTQFRIVRWSQLTPSCIDFMILADPNVQIFSSGTTKNPQIERIEETLRECIRFVQDNYEEYCHRAVRQEMVKTIPLSILLEDCPWCGAVLVASRRRYLTPEQLDYLAESNINKNVRLVTYDALIEGSLRSRFF